MLINDAEKDLKFRQSNFCFKVKNTYKISFNFTLKITYNFTLEIWFENMKERIEWIIFNNFIESGLYKWLEKCKLGMIEIMNMVLVGFLWNSNEYLLISFMLCLTYKNIYINICMLLFYIK